ncbi:MAG: hypothetical protein A2460_00405, partial [Omnitrophica WOR_2 bacterium RIFOXYC2_FULL_43_9]
MKKPNALQKAIILFLIQLVLSMSVYSAAEDLSDALEGEATIYLGETKVFDAALPKRVAIGNPLIADVSSVSETTIVVVSKAVGITTLLFSDSQGEHAFQLQVLAEDLTDDLVKVNAVLKELRQPNIRARLVDTNDKILLQGDVKTQYEKDQILIALGELKDKVADLIDIKEDEKTIDIDVEVLEIDKDATKTLGMNVPGSLDIIETGSPGIQHGVGTKWSTLFKVLNLERGTADGASPFTFSLDALIQEGKARVLSRPRLACQSGKEAELLVGGEKPILTTEVAFGGGSGTKVTYKEYGIKLNIKPTVTENERIKVSLNVEVSDVGAAETIGSATQTTAKAFPLTKRTASTELFLNSGQTLLIGGLTKEKEENSVRKTPFLGDLPIVGMLFRSKSDKHGGGRGELGNVELVILVTPRIISEQAKGNVVTGETTSLPHEVEDVSGVNLKAHETSKAAYASAVRDSILKDFQYPPLARDYSMQGTV